MNNLSRDMVSEEGKKETVVATSNDNYKVKLNGNYTLSNHSKKKENKFVKKFQNSIFGSDIGVKSNGFSSIAVLALVIALTVVFILYLLWRF